MNWLTNFVKPKLSALVSRRSVPDNLWKNCPTCGNMMHHKDLNENLDVCNNCNYHFRMSIDRRIETFFKNEEFNEIDLDKIDNKFVAESKKLLPHSNYFGLSITQGNVYRKKEWPLDNVVKICNELNKKNKILIQYAGSWNDPAKGKEITLALYQQGLFL